MIRNRRYLAALVLGVPGLALSGLALSIGATPASAQCDPDQTLPPGNAQIDQYVESIPGDCGNEQISRKPDRDADEVAPETLEALEARGAAGQAAAELALANAPQRGVRGGASGSDAGRSFSGGLSSTLSGTTGDDGLGLLLPLLLGGTLAAGIAFLVWRRWRTHRRV